MITVRKSKTSLLPPKNQMASTNSMDQFHDDHSYAGEDDSTTAEEIDSDSEGSLLDFVVRDDEQYDNDDHSDSSFQRV